MQNINTRETLLFLDDVGSPFMLEDYDDDNRDK